MVDRNKQTSERLFAEALQLFPGGVHSPVRAFKSVDGSPVFMERGEGCHLFDVDGNDYIDFCCSWGPLILGHNPTHVRERVIEVIQNGTSFGTPTALGNAIGRCIIDHHGYIDKIRFVSSGTEAVMSAIRLARGVTGKSGVVKFEGCYHGHVDSLLVKAGSGLATFGVSTSAGIPPATIEDTHVLQLNDLDGVSQLFRERHSDIACLIIEPIPANNGLLLQDTSFLVWLRKLCDEYGILLIFDEVISGFRVGFEGAAGFYHIQPDIITFGKIIGGGMPVGAYAGRQDIMSHVAPEGNVYQAGTLSANPVAMAAGLATLQALLNVGFYESLESKTRVFVERIRAHYQTRSYDIRVEQMASIFWLQFSNRRAISAADIQSESMVRFKKFHGLLLDRGVYLGPSGYEVGFVSAAHRAEDLEKAADIICDSLDHVMTD